jgi:hypothetical protein
MPAQFMSVASPKWSFRPRAFLLIRYERPGEYINTRWWSGHINFRAEEVLPPFLLSMRIPSSFSVHRLLPIDRLLLLPIDITRSFWSTSSWSWTTPECCSVSLFPYLKSWRQFKALRSAIWFFSDACHRHESDIYNVARSCFDIIETGWNLS